MPSRDISHYRVPRPAVVSFSGGRSSAYMLSEIVRAHNGRLPDDIAVVFANTGAEGEETLRFVDRVARELEVDIAWVEYDWEAPYRTRLVSFETASRKYEPFASLIERKGFVPNVTLRFCTGFLKRDRIESFARYWIGWRAWHSVIGLRADEPSRIQRMRARDCGASAGLHTVLPLDDARVAQRDVADFWSHQDYDLEIESGEGNCTFCFLKARSKLLHLMRKHPDRAGWWVEQERGVQNRTNSEGEACQSLKRFREDETYAQLFEAAMRQGDLWMGETDEESIDCLCTD